MVKVMTGLMVVEAATAWKGILVGSRRSDVFIPKDRADSQEVLLSFFFFFFPSVALDCHDGAAAMVVGGMTTRPAVGVLVSRSFHFSRVYHL